MIKAEIIKDSIGAHGVRITTFILTYPRFIHSEFMTHRLFSRNTSSSRAIPVSKQIESVLNNPAIPIKFFENKPGMQGGREIENQEEAIKIWLEARDKSVEQAKKLLDLNIHKQHINRLLEPFSHITVICTATDYDNFFALRDHPDAQPEFQVLARKIKELYESNKPKRLKPGEWHIPFVREEDYKRIDNFSELEVALIRSVARCARVSYNKHDGTESTFEDDLRLYNRLKNSKPIHASPFEHQAMCLSDKNIRCTNIRGWLQYRKLIENESVS